MTEEEALKRVASYCATAEHCRMEVEEKLQRWEIADDAKERIFSRLEAEKYIDEERYCRAFVNDKFRFAKWGKKKIAQALYLKRVSAEVSWRCLADIDEEEYLAVLRNLLAGKRRSTHAKNAYELNGKLIRFALSRGFELKDIKQCVEISEEDEYAC